MTPTKKDFFLVRFLRTIPLPYATGWKSAKNLCAEIGSPEKRETGEAVATPKKD